MGTHEHGVMGAYEHGVMGTHEQRIVGTDEQRIMGAHEHEGHGNTPSNSSIITTSFNETVDQTS